ncbi:MAG: DNA gyrase inhibitor YacG [Hyphomicrobium sp.]
MVEPSPSTRPPKCPICVSPTDPAYRPFCSRRCADVDLGRWFTGGYVLAGVETDEQTESSGDPKGEKPGE